jgi:phosphoribosyl-AMP cyclohydrolase
MPAAGKPPFLGLSYQSKNGVPLPDVNVGTPFNGEKDKGMIQLDFDKVGGLIPAIVQDDETGEILMLAYMNADAWQATLATGKATYYSRSRQKLWIKGETSGHNQLVKEIRIDCDDDTVLLKVKQLGAGACHTGHRSCFYKRVVDNAVKVDSLPAFDPTEVYHK